jgi:beta-N-acetylhexosaminidase
MFFPRQLWYRFLLMFRKWMTVLPLMLCLAGAAFPKSKDGDRFQRPGPVKLDRDGEKWAQRTLKSMSLEEKIGQMIMVWAKGAFINVNSEQYATLRDAMNKYHLGGFGFTVPTQFGMVVRTEPYEAAALINQLQRDSKLPLIVAADFERGLSMRLNGGTAFPHAMAFGAAGKPEYAEAFGRISGEEARAIGVEWNWFPDADVNSNPANPIINTRSFGEDPKVVSDMVAAYIKGAHESGLLTTAKHFPGHGDTAADSHLGLAVVSGDREHLESVELPPFRAAIDAGVDAVMVAHLSVPALDSTPGRVATTSPLVINELLKHAMHFKGLVIPDALDMGALMKLYARPGTNPSSAAAVAVIKAGCDMIIIPADVDAAYNGLLNAARSGEIPLAQIDASVLKILEAKASVGLHKARLVDLDAVNRTVQDSASTALAQRVADEAVTLVRDNGRVLPLKALPRNGTAGWANPYVPVDSSASRILAIVMTDDVRGEWGGQFERQLRLRAPDAKVRYVDPETAKFEAGDLVQSAARAEKVIVAVYSTPSAGRALNDPRDLLNAILARAGEKTVVVALGSANAAQDVKALRNYVCTFSSATVSETSAVRALFGEISIHGRLPVTIPGVAERGAGIDLPAHVMQGGLIHASRTKTAVR